MTRWKVLVFVATSVLVIAALFFETWWSTPLFAARWLAPPLVRTWSDGVFLAVLLLAMAVGSTSVVLWSGALVGAAVRRRQQGFAWAAAVWTTLTGVDLYVRFRLHEVYGSRFDPDLLVAAAESPAAIARNVWRWAPWEVVGVGCGLVLGIGAIRMGMSAASRAIPDTWHRPFPSMAGRLLLPAAFSASLVALSAMLLVWPRGHQEITAATTVGRPLIALLSTATDFDGDGWGYLDVPADSKPFDPECRPFAQDIPDDGIDQDLIGGDLRLDHVDDWARSFGESPTSPLVSASPNGRNVVVVFMESVRFDALSTVIDGTPVMGELRAAIARGALAPQHAYATQGYTYSSVKQFLFGGFQEVSTTVVNDFVASGYAVGVFSGYILKEESFGKYLSGDVVFDPTRDPKRKPRHKTTPARRLAKQMDRFFAQYRNVPFFAFAFLVDPHFPYKQDNPLVLAPRRLATREITAENKEAVRRIYFNQVYHVDRAAGAILASLRRHGLSENTTVVFISDHGEALFDDGATIGHGVAINDVMTHLAAVVVNPTVDVPDVFSHLHLRRWLHRTISTPLPAVGRLVPRPDRMLFQYIGSLRYPHAIGLWSQRTGRIVYQLRTNAWTYQGSTLDSAHRQRLRTELINKWEMLLL